VGDIGELAFDLLAQGGDSDTPLAAAEQLAATRFADQVRKASLEPAWVIEARLRVTKWPDAIGGTVNGHACVGYDVYFRVSAVMDDRKHYACEQLVFVAPHDPRVELRRRPENWGTGSAVRKCGTSEV
jgi:hypothetical protein